MTTLQTIADHLGLSRATVSRALNGYPEVNQKTRERVQAIARELNYTPNLNARQLATGRSGMIAMMLLVEHQQIQDLNQIEFMSGLSLAIENQGLDLVFHVVRHADDLAAYRRFLSRGTVDGMILNSPKNNDPRVPLLMEAGMPFVMHGRADGAVEYAYYDIDNEGIFSRATKLLLDLGHRQIVLLNGPQHLAYARQRQRGFQQALQRSAMLATQCPMIHTDLTEEAGYQQAMKVLQTAPIPSAFLCSSTLQAAGVYRAAQQLELHIGKDLAVIAHDDDLPHWRAESFTPALTVTRSPIRDACEPLAQMIHALINGANAHALQQTVKPDLIIRDSTMALS